MVWPCPGTCPRCVRHVSASCPLCVHPLRPHWPRLQTLSAMPPPCDRLASAMCPPESALAALQTLSARLASGLCPLLACCGVGTWHHQAKFFYTTAEPTAYIFHAASFNGWDAKTGQKPTNKWTNSGPGWTMVGTKRKNGQKLFGGKTLAVLLPPMTKLEKVLTPNTPRQIRKSKNQLEKNQNSSAQSNRVTGSSMDHRQQSMTGKTDVYITRDYELTNL